MQRIEPLTSKGLAQKELKEQNNQSSKAETLLWLEKSSDLGRHSRSIMRMAGGKTESSNQPY